MITFLGLNSREHLFNFQNLLLNRNVSKDFKLDQRMFTQNLGKNLSAFIYEKNEKKLLVLLDADDGSGGTPYDCKMSWPVFNDILRHYRPHDYMILKQHVNTDPECNQFYPFKEDVYPIGMFARDPAKIFEASSFYTEKNMKKEIDVFFAGGMFFSNYRPIAWPKNRDFKRWWAGVGIRGYKKIKEIKEKRKDLNIQIFDENLPQDKFFEMIHQSKICLDFPGVGKSCEKFFEYLIFGSCVISLTQQKMCWPCEENVHYCSLGDDYDYDTLEQKIDYLLENPKVRQDIEKNLFSIREDLKLESLVKKAESFINSKFESINSCVISY